MTSRHGTEAEPCVYLCCIGKNENRYVREFVEWYRKTGFSHIVIYDNNDIDGERFEDVIRDYIDEGFVEITDFRGKKMCQLEAYADCYKKNRQNCDWIAFFDMDEFLDLKQDSSIGEYLARDIFRKYGIIHINWVCYGDNGHLHYHDAPLTERFPIPAPADIMHSIWHCPTNGYIKSIVRCNKRVPMWWKKDGHTPFPTMIRACNSYGKRCDAEDCSLVDNSPVLASLRHYTTKSTEEYLAKLERGYADQIMDRKRIEEMLSIYFDINPDTEDRREYMAAWLENYSNTVR